MAYRVAGAPGPRTLYNSSPARGWNAFLILVSRTTNQHCAYVVRGTRYGVRKYLLYGHQPYPESRTL
jgi:hypothetical protein